MVNLTAECPNCQKTFVKKRKHQKFCCPDCRWKYWVENNPRISLDALLQLKKKNTAIQGPRNTILEIEKEIENAIMQGL